MYDLLSFNNCTFEAISFKFKKVLEENGLIKWKCFPIQIESISEQYFVFYDLSVAGNILNLEKVNDYEEDIKFDISTWDGSDIFHLKNTLCTICTEDVKNVLEKNKITNVKFEKCFGITI
jgi:hypothetical protein